MLINISGERRSIGKKEGKNLIMQSGQGETFLGTFPAGIIECLDKADIASESSETRCGVESPTACLIIRTLKPEEYLNNNIWVARRGAQFVYNSPTPHILLMYDGLRLLVWVSYG